jgi:hypothetical protein
MDPDKPTMLAASVNTSTPSRSPRPVSDRSHATQLPGQVSRNKTELKYVILHSEEKLDTEHKKLIGCHPDAVYLDGRLRSVHH